MKAQKPAQGILLTNDWGDAKNYHIECDCSSSDHAVNMWIEVQRDKDIPDVEVSFYVDTWTPFWDSKFNRDRKSTRLNSSHSQQSRMPSSA